MKIVAGVAALTAIVLFSALVGAWLGPPRPVRVQVRNTVLVLGALYVLLAGWGLWELAGDVVGGDL